MEINKELGQEIIRKLSEYIAVAINIIDLEGKIVFSTDESRIGEIHEGAIQVIRSEKKLILTQDNVYEFHGAKKGVNLPIIHQNKMVGVVGVSGEPDEIMQITGLVRVAVEIIIEQIHIQRQEHFIERQWSHWVHQLLHPNGFDKAGVEKDAIYSLGINPDKDWRVIVLKGKWIQENLKKCQGELKSLDIDYLFVMPFSSDEIIITLPSTGIDVNTIVKSLQKVTGKKLKIGIGGLNFGVGGIRESYLIAKQVLAFQTENTYISFGKDWELERLLVSIPENKYNSICVPYTQALEKMDNVYIQTIDAFFQQSGSVKETASLLNIHRNTLLYRLDQIKEKVGLNPRNFREAFILKIIRVY